MEKPGQIPKVQQLTINDEQAGQRVDNFLMGYLKGVPKTLIYRILRKGEVRVNRGRVKAEYRLQSGDLLRIPPVRVSEAKSAPKPAGRDRAALEQRIIFEDKDLLVINKPSGMAVHGGSGLSYGVIEAMRQLRPQARRLELVHRLDRDTSGCLILAKKTTVLRDLHEQIRADNMLKLYLALIQGDLPKGPVAVTVPLRKNVTRSGERMVVVAEDGKPSHTEFKAVQRFGRATLAEAKLFTGRTHQIRVHAKYIGQPIAGDDKYGDGAFNRDMKARGLKRLFLHARALSFTHPGSGEELAVTAPLDDDLKAVLDKLSHE